MKFHSAAQEKAYNQAMTHKFKAIAFDIDGTLTPFSRFVIPDSLHQAMSELPEETQLILCTGRNLSFIKHKLDNIIKHFPNPEKARKRWSIISDNGGAAYVYSPQKKDYKRIYEVPWPKKQIDMETLSAFIKERFGWHTVIVTRERTMVVVFPKYFYFFPRMVRRLSNRLARQLNNLLQQMELSATLKVQNSGLGSLIIPIESGKGFALKAWAKDQKISLKDVLCIGDSPGPGENDEDFLNGECGTAFSVGKQVHSVYPLPVLDARGRKLWGPPGTEVLLRELFL